MDSGYPTKEQVLRRIKVAGPDDCWLWTGYIRKPKGPNSCWNHYGMLRTRKRNFYAHRLAYHYLKGPVPDGMFVLHGCDNPPCCNPNHLCLGTAEDNNRDMVERGRWRPVKIPAGEAHPNARLTEADVRLIRLLAKAGIQSEKLAARFGVGVPHIKAIRCRKKWKHVA